MNAERCPHPTKARWPLKVEANHALLLIWSTLARAGSADEKQPRQAYLCRCGTYHLSSMTLAEFEALPDWKKR